MNTVHTSGAVSGTCSLEMRRLLPLVSLVCFTVCFTVGTLSLPLDAWAAKTVAFATSAPLKNASGTTAKKSPVPNPANRTAAKKTRTVPYVRSLASDAERASLRERGISSGFGPRAISRKKTRLHKGIDVPAPKGSKVVAYNDGEVIFTGVKNGYGRTVIIRQLDGREALYAHMSKYVVSIGDQLRRGDQVGHVGRTGRATGYHLHFEIIDEGENLDPALHVWHGSELVLGPGDLDPDAPGQTRVASPTPRKAVPLH